MKGDRYFCAVCRERIGAVASPRFSITARCGVGCGQALELIFSPLPGALDSLGICLV